jgi:cobalt/nickel transport system permease protein
VFFLKEGTSMPDWLTSQNEDALLLDKKNSFLMKNQKGLLFILGKFDHRSERSAASAIHPSLRFLSTLALLLIVSLSQKMLVLWICGLYIFSGLLFFSQKDLKKILGKSVLLSAMPFLIYLPSLLLHQGTFLFLIRVPLIACLISQ